ncbi:Crp/Fnr family transcriptional regulator [Segnochrobactrum spirostomi]|uniref:Crp/Fnr family transcriptional regulator n=1 Tax=Segnochrobactrum spirostomi TaxID=2608987 RepID=A0A6A7XZY1_9HYPH|nr:Crp/Fnr family transcriptional regulator [Segnochrobactrum spirostomi]MQT12370.1 Crp/Fnr family transcriptional regulator [Segnochrobactrum spirostomi]
MEPRAASLNAGLGRAGVPAKPPAVESLALSIIASHPLFADLAADEQRALVARGRLAAFDKDETVIAEGHANPRFYVAVTGQFSCRKASPHGLVFAFDQRRPGEFFGESALLHHRPSEIEVVAATASTAWMLAGRDLAALMDRHPWISRRLIDEITRRLDDLANLSFELATMKVDERLRRAIEKLARASHQLHDGGVIRPAPTHAELATMLGTTREVVSRALTALCREGLIETGRQQILIRSASSFHWQGD